jgi:hypothetical protein
MTTLVDNKLRREEHIEYEVDKQFSREKKTITGGSYGQATVLGEITATGKLTQLAPAAADGSEVAVAVLYNDCDASLADKIATVNDGMTIYKSQYLVWPAGITDPQKATAIKQLRAAGQKVRDPN